MATNFPGSADSFTNPSSGSSLSSPSHADQHANVNDAVEAIETALLDGAPLHIDDVNERVGIGTTSPQNELHIQDGSSGATADTGTYTQFVVEDSTNAGIHLISPDTGVGRVMMGTPSRQFGSLMRWDYPNRTYDIGTDDASGEIAFRTGNFAERMRIDSSGNTTFTGYVSQPRAFFRAYRRGSQGWSLTGAQAIVFENTVFNNGNNYSTSNGRFTAPVAGYYHLGAHFFKYTTYTNSTNTYWGIFTSNGYSTTTNHGTQGQDGGQSLSCVVYMGANDYADVQITSAGSTLMSYGTMTFNSFYGYLLSA